jgi:hypothetical protein
LAALHVLSPEFSPSWRVIRSMHSATTPGCCR